MTKINKLASLFDEQAWNSDSFLAGSSLYKVNSSFVSSGTIDGSLDHDYYVIDGFLTTGSTYEIHLTSDSTNHGWSSNNESTFLEFDLYDYNDNLLGSSTLDFSRSLYDDVLEFTVPSDYKSWQPYYIDVHGLVFDATDYALTLNSVNSTPAVNNPTSGTVTIDLNDTDGTLTAEDIENWPGISGSAPANATLILVSTYSETGGSEEFEFTATADGTWAITEYDVGYLPYDGTYSLSLTAKDSDGNSLGSATADLTFATGNTLPEEDSSGTVTIDTRTHYEVPVIRFELSEDDGEDFAMPKFIGMDTIDISFSSEPSFFYSYEGENSDVNDYLTKIYSFDDDVKVTFLDTEIALFDANDTSSPAYIDLGIERTVFYDGSAVDLLWAHVDIDNDSLDSEYLGSFFWAFNDDLEINNQIEFEELFFGENPIVETIRIPDGTSYGPDQSDWLLSALISSGIKPQAAGTVTIDLNDTDGTLTAEDIENWPGISGSAPANATLILVSTYSETGGSEEFEFTATADGTWAITEYDVGYLPYDGTYSLSLTAKDSDGNSLGSATADLTFATGNTLPEEDSSGNLPSNDVIVGTASADTIYAGEGADFVAAGAGSDTIELWSSSKYHSGYFAHNVETGSRIWLSDKTKYSSVIDGEEDADTIILMDNSNGDAFFLHDAYSDLHESVSTTADDMGMQTAARVISVESIIAGDGDDIIDLTSDTFDMGGTNITLKGEEGDDVLWAAEGNDTLDGGIGDDTLFGGDGDDILTGGDGADVFEFVNSTSAQTDTITDYTFDDTLRFYLGDGDSQITQADYQNGTLTWGNLTIALDSSLAWDDLSIVYA